MLSRSRARARRLTACALTALALPAAVAAAPAHAAEGMEVAIQDDAVLNHQRYFDRGRAYGLIRQLNASRIRFNVIWAGVNASQATQTSPPSSPAYDFTRLDQAVDVARSQGMRVQLSLTGPAPAWAAGDRRITPKGTIRPNPRYYAKFVRAVVNHFRGRVDAYAIWNEPNHISWLRPLKEQGRLYRGLYQAAFPQIRRADPTAQILIAETAPYPSKKGVATEPLKFLRDLACVNTRFRRVRRCKKLVADGYAHHPYDFARAPRQPHKPAKGVNAADVVTMANLNRLTSALDRIARVGTLVSADGDPMPLWLTEYGYFARKEGRETVFPERRRATYLKQAFEIALRHPRVQSMLQYLLIEYPVGMFRFNTSIVKLDGTPMRPYRSLRSWAAGKARRKEIALPGPVTSPPPPPPGPSPQPQPPPPGPEPCAIPIPPGLPCPI